MAYTGSKAKSGRSTAVSIGGQTGATGTPTFTHITECDDVSPSGGDYEYIDISNFDSDRYSEFLATMIGPIDWTLKFNVIDSDPGQQALIAAYGTGFKYDFKIQLAPGQGQTTGTLYAFSASVTNYYNFSITTKSAIMNTVKLRESGPPTVTPGS